MEVIFVADFFFPETLGGAEQSDGEFINLLNEEGHSVFKIRTNNVTLDDVEKHKEKTWFVSNLMNLNEAIKQEIVNKKIKFFKIEHDHQYLVSRDPSPFADYCAPISHIINEKFYQSAKKIIVQTRLHDEIIHKNLKDISTFVVGGNLWTDFLLDRIEFMLLAPKNDVASIMVSQIAHKNTHGAVRWCQATGHKYELISPTHPELFLENLSKNEKFVFLPLTVETCSRIVVEAKMLGCQIITNDKIGAASEPWFSELKGKELVKYMKFDIKNKIREFLREELK